MSPEIWEDNGVEYWVFYTEDKGHRPGDMTTVWVGVTAVESSSQKRLWDRRLDSRFGRYSDGQRPVDFEVERMYLGRAEDGKPYLLVQLANLQTYVLDLATGKDLITGYRKQFHDITPAAHILQVSGMELTLSRALPNYGMILHLVHSGATRMLVEHYYVPVLVEARDPVDGIWKQVAETAFIGGGLVEVGPGEGFDVFLPVETLWRMLGGSPEHFDPGRLQNPPSEPGAKPHFAFRLVIVFFALNPDNSTIKAADRTYAPFGIADINTALSKV